MMWMGKGYSRVCYKCYRTSTVVFVSTTAIIGHYVSPITHKHIGIGLTTSYYTSINNVHKPLYNTNIRAINMEHRQTATETSPKAAGIYIQQIEYNTTIRALYLLGVAINFHGT